MHTTDETKRALREARDSLVQHAGYAPALVREDYAFADPFDEGRPELRRVALAAFAEEPTSYRSSAVAVAVVAEPGEPAARRALVDLRALAAPVVITLDSARARCWRLRSGGPPDLQEDEPQSKLGEVIRRRAVEWAPESVLRAKRQAPIGGFQLELFDDVEVVERRIFEKLDYLLRAVLGEAREALEDRPDADRRDAQDLLRFVLWLVTAKVLADRGAISGVPGVDPALDAAGVHFGIQRGAAGPIAFPRFAERHPAAAAAAWASIERGFHFQNVSVDALAMVYENTLVDGDTRRRLGVHSTPREVAELVLRLLPIEGLPPGRDRIVELCAGPAPFLLAAMRQLKQAGVLPTEPAERHAELVRRLRGVELDPFALEVSRLCLTLADYPNKNGWDLTQDDVFAQDAVRSAIAGAGCVLSNPPFERFREAGRARYDAAHDNKAAELLARVLESPPPLLGLVLPKRVLDGGGPSTRRILGGVARVWREIDRVDVPDNAFAHSGVESVLLIARDLRAGRSVSVRAGGIQRVPKGGGDGAWTLGPWRATTRTVTELEQGGHLGVGHFEAVWARLSGNAVLGSIAEIGPGLQYLSKEAGGDCSQSAQRAGVDRADRMSPYRVLSTTSMEVSPGFVRRGSNHRWSETKVLVNAARRSRGLWCLSAAVDREGLVASQRIHIIVPTRPQDMPAELVCAILNGPVANAWAREPGARDIQVGVLKALPLPDIRKLAVDRVVDLVREYEDHPDLELALDVDAEILKGYDLPPRVERDLLRSFEGEQRVGVQGFDRYYPPGFTAALPLHVVRSLDESQTAGALLRRVPTFDDPAVSALFERIEAGF